MTGYFKQAWNIIRQEKLFSSIYITGTGLAIAVVMTLSIIIYLNVADIYPETNRSRILIADRGVERYGENGNDGMSSSSLSYKTYETCFTDLKGAEAVTMICGFRDDDFYIQKEGSREQIQVKPKFIDTKFWTVFPFRFIDGVSFSEADFASGINSVVIAESIAKRLFGTTEVSGRRLSLNFVEYRISGVVRDASFVTPHAFAQIYLPYTTFPDYKKDFGQEGSLGSFTVYILARSGGDLDAIRSEVLDNIARYNRTLKEGTVLSLAGRPERMWQNTLRQNNDKEDDARMTVLLLGLIFLIALLVPAVSLSGMTESRMERRMSEMGVRRAFGAPTGNLMGQIIWENFLFTALGGIAGLLLSYVVVLLGRDWILQLGRFKEIPPEGSDVMITPAMLLNFSVFASALGVCFLLNIMSSIIPAWRASRREIIHSLNNK